jgi:hypothetical protein
MKEAKVVLVYMINFKLLAKLRREILKLVL